MSMVTEPHKPAPGRVAAAANARAARLRTKHNRWANELREHGWTCTPPEDTEQHKNQETQK